MIIGGSRSSNRAHLRQKVGVKIKLYFISTMNGIKRALQDIFNIQNDFLELIYRYGTLTSWDPHTVIVSITVGDGTA